MIFVFCLPLSTKVDPLDFFPTFYNMQSVSSNAVAQQVNALNNSISNRAPLTRGVYYLSLTPRQLNTDSTFCDIISNIYNQGYLLIIFSVSWDEYQTFPHPGAGGYIMFGTSSARGIGQLWEYGSRKVMYGCAWTDRIAQNSYTPWASI